MCLIEKRNENELGISMEIKFRQYNQLHLGISKENKDIIKCVLVFENDEKRTHPKKRNNKKVQLDIITTFRYSHI